MKNKIYSTACAIALSAIMTVQTLGPAASLVIADTIDEEPEVTVESTVTNDDEDPVIVVESSDETTSSDPEYVEETTDLTDTTTDETSDEEEIVSTATNTDPTDTVEAEETEAVDETIAETEESEVTEPTDEELDEELEEIEYIEFDHYYSEINEAAVSTSDLFVITGDSSVFTRNTNVVSNYDDAYIIECSSVEEARFVYSYYIDKVDFITDMSTVVSVATADETDLDTTDPVDVTEPLEEDIRNIPDEEVPTEETQDYVDESVTPDIEETTTSGTDEITDATEPVEQEPDVADLSDLNNGNDAIANLNDIDTVHNDYTGYIALIDTGANAHANFTVLGGDTFDHNGHGTDMLGYIRSENPLAQVVSIKVSEDGNATAADIYAGFRLAIDLNVSVINLSMTGIDGEQNAIIKTIIQEAIDAGIVVIGSAGNNGVSARYFIPGCIDDVITIGAVDDFGTKIAISNYNADYYVVADSTSEAAARYTGIYTAGLADISLKVFDQVEEDDDYIPDDYAWAYEAAQLMTDHLQITYGYGFVEVVFNDDGTPAWHFCMDETAQDGFFGIAAGGWDIGSDATTDLGAVSATLAPGTYNGQCDFVRDASGKGHVTNFDNAFGTWLNSVGAGNVGFICSKYFSEVDNSSQSAGAASLEDGRLYYRAVCTDTGSGLRILITISERSDMSQPTWDQTATGTQSYTVSYVDSTHIRVTIGNNSQTFSIAEAATRVSSAIATYVNDAVATEYSGKKGVTVTSTGFAAPTSGGSSRTCTATYTYKVASGTQVYAGLVTTGNRPTSGAVAIRKVNGNTGLSGAVISITGPLDSDSWGVTGVTSPSRNGNTLTFTTTTGTAEVRGLLPYTDYSITEVTPPTGFGLPSVRTVSFRTDANGNPETATSIGEWSWNSNTFTYTLNNSRTGGLVFNKIDDSNGTEVTGAGIFFAAATTNTVPNPFAGVTVTGGTYYTSGTAITMPDGSRLNAPADGYYFVTSSSNPDFTANNLVAGATYIFTEIFVPNNYGKATDIVVTVDGQGNISPNSGSITMREPGNIPFGSLALEKIVDSVDQFGFFSTIYARHDHSLTWGWPLIAYGASAMQFSARWYGADAEQAAGMFTGRLPYGAGAIAEGYISSSGGTSRRVIWTRGAEYDSFVAGLPNGVWNGCLPFKWMDVSTHESTWEIGGQGQSHPATLGYLPVGYYTVQEHWNSTVFGPFRGDAEATALYAASMNTGGWTCIQNTGLSQTWVMMYHVTESGTYRCSVTDSHTIIDTGSLEHRADDLYNVTEYNTSYAQNAYVDRISLRNENVTTQFDVTKIDESGLGVDGVRMSLWRNGQEVALGFIANPDNPTRTASGADQYNVTWAYQLNSSEFGYTDDLGREGHTFTFAEVYAPSRGIATWIVRNNTYRDNGGVWGEAPANYAIGPSYTIPHLPIYWQTPDWIAEAYISNNEACAAYYGEGGSNGGLGNNSHYAGTADTIDCLPLGAYQVREYYDPSINQFDTPEGWNGPVTDSTGTYFYRDINIGNEFNGASFNVTVVNEAIGRIDVSKVNHTGGPLNDLLFEVYNTASNTLVASGTIPNDAAPTAEYTYSVNDWSYRTANGWRNEANEAVVGLGTFEVREYVPATAFDDISDLTVSDGWSGPYTSNNYPFEGETYYYFTKTVTITEANASDTQVVTAVNEIHPVIGTTMTDFANRHITVVGEEIEFTDTVSYDGVYIGGSYIMHATLMENVNGVATPVTDAEGNPYVAETAFTATAGSGTVDVTFIVNTAHLVEASVDENGVVSYSPKDIVCFESLQLVGGLTLTTHADITDDAQTVTIDNPEIGTTLTSVQNVRDDACVGETVEFVDTVTYTNLHAGEYYVITAFIMDKAEGTMLLGPDGVPYSASVTFRAEAESGTIDVPITINTAAIIEADLDDTTGIVTMHTKDIVCYEYLYSYSNILIGGHTDINDEGQTITITPPDVHTTFVDVQTEEHETVSGRVVEVVDTVTYTNLHVGETYNLTCYLFDQTSGQQLVYSNGDPVVGTQEFLARTENGTVQVRFTIDTSDLQVNFFNYVRHTYVAFEYLRTVNDILIAGHTAIDDHYQWVTPNLPRITTAVIDDQSGTQEGRLGSEVPFTDTVYYNNLNEGEWYQIRGRVVSQNNANQVWATNTVDFQATGRSGYVEVPFVIDTSEICQGSNDANIVCFEQLWQLDTEGTGRGEVMLDKHEDLTDENQTIYLTPRLETQMIDPITNSEYGMIGEDVEFIDTISYHRLRIGETYTVTGVLMDHQLNAPILDENGQVITASTTFVPDATEGTVEVHYHLNTLRLIQEIGTVVDGVLIDAPREIVSFETVTSQSGFDFAIHADIEDDLQTIILGDIHSSAGDIQTSTRWCAAGLTTIQDTVHYRGLGPVEYTVVGSLHLVDYDEDGNPVDGGLIPARTGEVTETTYTWTPTNHEGDIVLDYRLDTSRYEGRDIIVFEELYYNGIRIIGHENYADVNGGFGMNNYEQTVHIPSVHTNAFSFQTGAQLLAVDENATINDFVYYGNVEVGRSYYVEGQLWACYTDENGFIHSTAIPAEQGGRKCSDTFTATAKSGSVEIQFTIDSTVLQGLHYDYIVVTERLIDVGSGVCVGNHGSLTDQDQTIYIPDVHTTASTTTGRTLPETSTEPVMVTVSDRVFYENLIPNKSYTVVGNLQYARTDANGNITESGALVQNGTPVTASLTFTPTSPSGYVDLTFNVDARSIMNQGYNRIVAFEDLYFGPEGVRVAVHADITDEEQTVRIPDMETTALGVNGRHTVAASANTTIRDTVAYYGLTPGREYRLETDLMSSRTNGSIAHVTTVFTPDTPDGVVTVELTADLSGYQPGDRVVVFEDLYDQPTGLLIKSHMDWDDEDQTVTITDHPETGVLDSNGFGYIVLAIATVVAGGFGIFLVNNKKPKKEKLDSENPTES